MAGDNNNNIFADQSQNCGPLLQLDDLIAEIDSKIKQTTWPDHQKKEPRKAAQQRSHIQNQYIKFLLEDITLAVPMPGIIEIAYLPGITPLPNLPDWVAGICNIRGEIISIIDLKLVFGWPLSPHGRNRHLIILSHQEIKTGIIANKIVGLLSLDQNETNIQANPFDQESEHKQNFSAFISGVITSDKETTYIIDMEKILYTP